MNRSILTALCAITTVVFPLSINAQLYYADGSSGLGTQTEWWIDASGSKKTTTTPVKVDKRVVWVLFPKAYLNEPGRGSYNIEWMDGLYRTDYPRSCSVAPGSSPLHVNEHLNYESSVATSQSEEVGGSLDPFYVWLKHHLEPVNKIGKSTHVSLILPGTISCDPGLGEFTVTVTGYSNVKKWGNGSPNARRTSQTFSIKYTPFATTISAEFSPSTISMTGVVNTYVENRTDLVVTTSGGTKVVIEWPDVSTVEYEQAGGWVKGHTQSVSVADGANKINKRIRVRSSDPGTTTISVPVTMTLI